MQIEKLEIKGFGKIEDTSLSLGKGINIIYGFNESGKSTLQWFIKSMLYGLKGGRISKDGIQSQIKRFKPWSGVQYGGSIEYRLDEGRLIRVERNFDNNTVAVYDENFNNITASFDFSREKGPLFAEKHLGINDTCFERTVLVRQMETRLDEESRSELLGRIANVSQTGFEDISLKVTENSLRDALKNFVGTEKTRTSPVDKMAARLDVLRALRFSAAERKGTVLDTETALRGAISEKTMLCEACDYMESIWELVELRKRLENEKAKAAALQEILDEVIDAERTISAATADYECLKTKAGSGDDIQSDAYKNIPSETDCNIKKKDKQRKIAALIFLLCSVPAAVVALMGNNKLFILAGALFAAGLLLIIMKSGNEKPFREIYTGGDADTAKVMDLKLKEIIRAKDILKNFCEKASAISGKPAGSALQVKDLLSETLAAEGSTVIKLKIGISEYANRFSKVESEFFSSRRLQSIITDSGLKWLEDSWNYENEQLEKKRDEIVLKIREYETLLKNGSNGVDELQTIDEEIAEIEIQKNKLEDTGASLKIALEVLAEAAEELHRDYAPNLNAQMSDIIKKITSGKYGELKADDKLSLLTISPDTGSVTQVPALSGGTTDQMYLALRLATADLAFRGEELPIMLDEAFSQYDDNRTLETLKFLKERYSEGQVLIFTSKAREVEFAEAVCKGNINLIRI